jgi:AcrR family transcriptional regulator
LPQGGRRARKKDETRRRITQAAMNLFLQRGFEATTLDDIAAAADVSKRSFFDYFPAKEDVILAWQDGFKNALLADVAARPNDEAPMVAGERAMIAALGRFDLEDVTAHARLRRETPALRARDQLKYETLERALAEALLARVDSKRDELRVRLDAMVLIGALRVASEFWLVHGQTETPSAFARRIVRILKAELKNLGRTDPT